MTFGEIEKKAKIYIYIYICVNITLDKVFLEEKVSVWKFVALIILNL